MKVHNEVSGHSGLWLCDQRSWHQLQDKTYLMMHWHAIIKSIIVSSSHRLSPILKIDRLAQTNTVIAKSDWPDSHSLFHYLAETFAITHIPTPTHPHTHTHTHTHSLSLSQFSCRSLSAKQQELQNIAFEKKKNKPCWWLQIKT